jgi:MFS family permease
VGLFLAHGVSMTGTSMSFLAIPWFVMVTTGSPTLMGLVTMAELLPYVLMQGLGGPLIDRFGAGRTSVLTDLAAALAMGLVPLSQAAGFLSLPLLVAAVGVAGTVRGAGDMARRVLLPRLCYPAGVPLERASGLFDGIGRLAGLVGAPLAGAVVSAASAPLALALDAASFALSAILVASIAHRAERPAREAGRGGPAEAPYLARLREGISHLKGDRLLLAIAVMVMMTNFLDQSYYSVLLPVWVREELGSPLALGAISTAFGIGAVAGNALMAYLAPRLPRRLPFAICFAACGAPRFLVLALSSGLAPVLVAAVISGLGAGGINPALGAVEYERVPAPLQARVLGAINALAWAGMPLGGLAGGVLADAFGLRSVLLALGAAYFLITIAPFAFPVWRQMERGSAVERAVLQEALVEKPSSP